MADNQQQQQPPSIEEALSKYGPQGGEVSDTNQPLSIDEALKKYSPQEGPISGNFADHFFSENPIGKVLSAFGQGPAQEWGAHPNGFSKDQEHWLDTVYFKNSSAFLKGINEAWMRPAATLLNTGAGLLSGFSNAVGTAGQELEDKSVSDQKSNNSPFTIDRAAGDIISSSEGELGDILKGSSDPNAGFIPEFPHGSIPSAKLPEVSSKARAQGLIGEGEGGYFNTVPPDESKMQARQEAAKEAGLPNVPEVKSPVLDMEQVARQINPDVFKEFDRLNDLREKILYPEDAKTLSPTEILNNRSKLFDINNQIKDLLPDLNESVRHAQEIMPTQEQLDNSVIKPQEEGEKSSTTASERPVQGEISPTTTNTGETLDGTPVTPAEAQDDNLATGFKTAKGSEYLINEDGTTTRNKAFRPEHGEAEQGLQPKSDKTYYVTSKEAESLGLFQAQGASGSMAIQELSDGRIGVKYLSGKDKGKFERRTVISPQLKPSKGLTPVEVWQDGKRVHFGNEITEINKAEKSTLLKGIEGTGKEASLGLSKSLESEFIERGLTDSFGDLPNYNKMVIKDQSAKVAELISSDPDRAFNIAMGKEEPPEGIHPESVWIGVKEQIKRSGDTAKGLLLGTKSILPKSANIMGQRLRLLGEKDPYDPVEAISNVQRAREASVNPKTLESTVKNIKDTVNKNKTPTNWTDFIRSIECDY